MTGTKQMRSAAFIALVLSSALLGACSSTQTTTTAQVPATRQAPPPPPPAPAPQRAPMVRG